jgi:hypothetical protein
MLRNLYSNYAPIVSYRFRFYLPIYIFWYRWALNLINTFAERFWGLKSQPRYLFILFVLWQLSVIILHFFFVFTGVDFSSQRSLMTLVIQIILYVLSHLTGPHNLVPLSTFLPHPPSSVSLVLWFVELWDWLITFFSQSSLVFFLNRLYMDLLRLVLKQRWSLCLYLIFCFGLFQKGRHLILCHLMILSHLYVIFKLVMILPILWWL